MQIYSARPAAFLSQLAGDIAALAIVAGSVAAGLATHAVVAPLGELGAGLQSSGSDFQRSMSEAAETLSGVPFIGGGIRSPFDDASDAAGVLAQAGRDQQTFVATAAVVLGILVALGPIALVLFLWLPRRLAFARSARIASGLATTPGGIDLLALRSLAAASPTAVLRLHPDPAAAWRAGDAAVIRSLAELELDRTGVRQRGGALRR